MENEELHLAFVRVEAKIDIFIEMKKDHETRIRSLETAWLKMAGVFGAALLIAQLIVPILLKKL